MTTPMRDISSHLQEDGDEQQRNTLIVLARSVGCSLRDIAEATGLSPQGVSKILERISS